MDGDRSTQTTEVRDARAANGGERVRRHTVTTRTATDGKVVAARVIWWIAGFIITLLAIRVLLQLLGANQESSFVDLIYSVSGIFAAPFYGMFNYQPSYGSSFFEISTVVAMIIYALVAWGISKLLTLTSNRAEA